MPVKAHRLVIELSPSCLVVTRFDAGVVADVASARFDTPLSGFTPSVLDGIRATLEGLLAELRVQGGDTQATVILSGPGAAAGAHSSPAGVTPGGAIHSARLSLEAICDWPLDHAPVGVLPIARDRAGKSSLNQLHLVAFSINPDVLEAVDGWVTAAGLTFNGALPSDAVRIYRAVAQALKSGACAEDRTDAVLHLDSTAGLLVATKSGSITLVRPITIGLEALVDALLRPIRPAPDSAQSVTIPREQAERLLTSVGIPTPDAVVPLDPPVRGAALLPALQQVLQRIGIEVKQSLRFGLSESDRAACTLGISGMGACVPRLGTVLAGLVGAPASATAADDAAIGIAETLLSLPIARHVLVPVEQAERRTRQRVRTAAVVGGAMALSLVAFNFTSDRSLLTSSQTQLDALSAASKQAERTAEAQSTAIAARIAMDGLAGRIDSTLSSGTDWPSFLAFLARSKPDAVKFREINCQTEREGSTARLNGYVPWSEDRTASDTVRSLIDTLSQCPLVQNVRLGATSKSLTADGESLAFEVEARLEPFWKSPVAAKASGEHRSVAGVDGEARP